MSRCCGQGAPGSSPAAPLELSLLGGGKTSYRQQNVGHPFLFSLRSGGLAGDPLAGASGQRRLRTLRRLKTTGQGWVLFWKGASPGSSPSCVRERITCFQVVQGVGKVRAGPSVPASSRFEPSLPSLSQAYKLFPGRATPWASNGARLARSSPVPGGEAGAGGSAGCHC